MTEIKGRPDPIAVTARAARRIAEVAAKDGRSGLRLRIGVSGGGCSGFRYGFELDASSQPDDVVVRRGEAEVVVDGMSLLYLLGAELDYVEDLTGSYFKISNPNATSSCGCGASFAV